MAEQKVEMRHEMNWENVSSIVPPPRIVPPASINIQNWSLRKTFQMFITIMKLKIRVREEILEKKAGGCGWV